MDGKTTIKTDRGNVEINHDDKNGQYLVTTIYQLEHEVQKYEQKIVNLECDKETWFTKYHDERVVRKKLQDELEEKKLDLELTKESYKKEVSKYYKKLKLTEAELFNLQQHYETVYESYCDLADFLAFKLGYKDTDDAMEEFKQWLVQK